MDFIKACRISAISTVLSFASVSVLAQDTAENRATAADRYLSVMPMAKIIDDIFTEFAKQPPYDTQPQIIERIKKVYRADLIEKASLEAMIKIFTADELNTMADYYGSKNGSSAMLKMGAYIGQVMPMIQVEVRRAIEEQKKSQPKK